MYIDTHTHLYAEQFDEDRKEVVEKAITAGITKLYLPNIDSGSIPGMLQLEQDFPDNCFAMMGLHPCSVKANYEEELAIVKEWLDKRPFVAVGEIGIDLYWDKTFFEEQKKAFLKQIEWAKDLNRPIVIHSREATDIIIDLLKTVKGDRLRGIFHCFTGNEEQALKIVDLGFYLGIGGVLTFKKAKLDEAISNISLDHIVLETDSPYLAPKPYRGKRNQSAYILNIAQKLSEVMDEPIEKIAEVTTRNALEVFH